MTDKRSKNEDIKEKSRGLRGTIAAGLADVVTGAIAEDDTQLVKFHGTYMQDDRDVRGERARKKLEKAFSFMLRVRIPGGVLTPEQWLAMDRIADAYANHTIRLTTRQAIQFHGVIKSNLKRTMQAINASVLDTLAACGDVNRNVMSAGNPFLSKAHGEAFELARRLSEHLLPRTGAYHEIWLDGEKIEDHSGAAPAGEEEPIYGRTYLPRKFKTVLAVPPQNDVDVYAHDLGFIAILERGKVVGWNVTVGGGMGMTHGELDTFPRTADALGFCTTGPGSRRRRAGRHRAARLGQPRRAQARAPEVHDRGPRDRGVPRRGRAAARLRSRHGAARSLHRHRRCHRLAAGRGQEVAPDAVHRERPRQGWPGRQLAHGIARDRRAARRRLRPHGQPEPDPRPCFREGQAGHHGDPGEPRHRAGDLLGAAAQQHGLRRAADVRSGAGRKRALPARARRRARGRSSPPPA